jgi:hypothetical protein
MDEAHQSKRLTLRLDLNVPHALNVLLFLRDTFGLTSTWDSFPSAERKQAAEQFARSKHRRGPFGRKRSPWPELSRSAWDQAWLTALGQLSVTDDTEGHVLDEVEGIPPQVQHVAHAETVDLTRIEFSQVSENRVGRLALDAKARERLRAAQREEVRACMSSLPPDTLPIFKAVMTEWWKPVGLPYVARVAQRLASDPQIGASLLTHLTSVNVDGRTCPCVVMSDSEGSERSADGVVLISTRALANAGTAR